MAGLILALWFALAVIGTLRAGERLDRETVAIAQDADPEPFNTERENQ